MNEILKVWNVKNVRKSTRKRFKDFAVKNKMELADVLDLVSKKL